MIHLHTGYAPHREQSRFHASGKRFLCAAAGARGGKTLCAAVEFARRLARDKNAGKGNKVSGRGRSRRPRLHYWVVAPTEALLREPLRYLNEVFPANAIENYYRSDNALWIKRDILIEFKTADNPLHLVSSGLHGLWIDEAARVKADAWHGQLRQRLSDHQGWALFSTTPLGRNWFYDEIVTKSGVDPDYETIHWTTADNPHVARAEIEAAKRQLPRRYFAREYLASFDAFIGTVFDEWDESIHLTTEQALSRELNVQGSRTLRSCFKNVVAGVDWGWNSPGAIVVVGDLGNRYVVLDESYAANRRVVDPRAIEKTWIGEARRLRDKWGVQMFYCDPSLPYNRDEFRNYNVPVLPAENDILYGIRRCSEALHPEHGTPRLRVLDACKNLIREIREYQWAQNKKVDGYVDIPAQNQSDHAIDALRYALVEAARYEGGEANSGFRPKRGPMH